MLRNILSVLFGLAAAILIFSVTEMLNSSIHPTPSDLNYEDNAAVKAFFADQPLSFWFMVLLGWGLGSFLCGLIIKCISKKDSLKLPIIAGIILTLSAVANFILLPHPTWFVIVGLIIFIPATLSGYKISSNG